MSISLLQRIEKNPGLRSRIAFNVPFADYSTDELCEIADNIASKKELEFSDGAKDKLAMVLGNARHEKDFGNGRYVRNLIEKASMAQASRLLKGNLDELTRRDVKMILPEDIVTSEGKSERKFQIGFVR